MENNPLRGLFGVSSPRPEAQRVAPQPTEPTKNIYYEIPSCMIEKLLANPYAGDGTLHPDLHLVHRDQNYIYNFWPREGESIAQAWGRLKSMLYSCPNHELSREIIIQNFYARLSRND